MGEGWIYRRLVVAEGWNEEREFRRETKETPATTRLL